jgi:PIN domain nuclease of toxin-antitoxin system
LIDFVEMATEKHQLTFLKISLPHIYHTQQLELIHQDPFDRIIASQALIENIQLISSDEIFDSYNVKRLW